MHKFSVRIYGEDFARKLAFEDRESMVSGDVERRTELIEKYTPKAG